MMDKMKDINKAIKEYDVVNRPKHYCREGGMECFDEMLLLFSREEVLAFCKLNAWKYRYRAAGKNGEEDLKKSDWYLKKYKELINQLDCCPTVYCPTHFN